MKRKKNAKPEGMIGVTKERGIDLSLTLRMHKGKEENAAPELKSQVEKKEKRKKNPPQQQIISSNMDAVLFFAQQITI